MFREIFLMAQLIFVAGNNYSKEAEEDKVASYTPEPVLEKSDNNGNAFMDGIYNFFNRTFSNL